MSRNNRYRSTDVFRDERLRRYSALSIKLIIEGIEGRYPQLRFAWREDDDFGGAWWLQVSSPSGVFSKEKKVLKPHDFCDTHFEDIFRQRCMDLVDGFLSFLHGGRITEQPRESVRDRKRRYFQLYRQLQSATAPK